MTVTENRAAVDVSQIRHVEEAIRAELLDCWTEVSNAGGSVGFVPPVEARDVAPLLDMHLARIAAGTESLVALRIDGRLMGFALLQAADPPLRAHWGMVQRVQVRPGAHGRGLGAALMRGVHEVARSMGLEMLRLSVRGGTGLEQFYARLGYTEFGRMPGAIRVAPGDDRDDILLYVRL